MLQVSQLIGLGANASKPLDAVATFVSSAADAADLTTYSFAGMNFGAAFSGRVLIACFAGRSAGLRTFVSADIGGVAAASALTFQDSNSHVYIVSAPVPTGTSGTVSITMSVGMVRMAVALYSVSNLISAIPTDVATAILSGGSLDVNILEGGFALGVAMAQTSTGAWTGLTERALFTPGTWESNGAMTSGQDNFAAAATPQAISVVASGSPAMGVASFR